MTLAFVLRHEVVGNVLGKDTCLVINHQSTWVQYHIYTVSSLNIELFSQRGGIILDSFAYTGTLWFTCTLHVDIEWLTRSCVQTHDLQTFPPKVWVYIYTVLQVHIETLITTGHHSRFHANLRVLCFTYNDHRLV